MGRLVWYAGVSTALAGGVIVSAFNQRANFYSACVYLAQSNLCLMILINLILFIYGTFMYGLQRLCYGPLRPIEIEQLYEKSWFAITETCLAMTIFREEVGAWFLVMFVALLTGKVWGWIGDGRVEVLEQQPPANPRLFHIRLSVSLTMSVIYDIWLMRYTINTVIQQARPNMMVMFLFELAILTSTSFATAFRYGISLVEAKMVKEQTRERLIERRREIREERAEMIRQREAAAATAAAGEETDAAQSSAPLPSEDDVDEMDIEVPGWEAKGHWVLTLDLITDFVKLGIYISFFVILLMFYGLPIHIMRDLFMTARSFMKRLAAFVKYRQATRDMNSTYEDATAEDIQRDDTCIICREEMRPWSVTNPEIPPAAPGAAPPRPANTVNERTRPKKLPCGHILHLGCLKSWLERQQVCPTCRRPVVDTQGQPLRAAANDANQAQGAQAQAPGQQDGAAGVPPQPRMRMLNFGPLRVGFGQANLQDFAQGIQQQGQDNGAAGGGNARIYGLELGFPRRLQPPAAAAANPNSNGENSIQDQLQQLEQQITTEIRGLQVTQQELNLVQLMQVELARLRLIQNGGADPLAANFQIPQIPQLPQLGTVTRYPPFVNAAPPQMSRHVARPNTAAIPSGSADLPPGVTIPEGWSLLPLERLDNGLTNPQTSAPASAPAASEGSATATITQTTDPTAPASNTTVIPTPTTNPEAHSQGSSDYPADTHATHTPPSIAAGQVIIAGPDTGTSSTTTVGHTAAQQDADILPNWGSSQLFSSRSLSGTLGDASEPSTASAAQSQSPMADGEPSVVAPSTSAAESCAGPSSAGEEQERTDNKGKAKAVTVEDVVDESEGS
ncbi:RING finger protein [Diplocarpon rosae]|nr:RING finger protein [Diplocarpon rosae]